jgi:hypothetical protein
MKLKLYFLAITSLFFFSLSACDKDDDDDKNDNVVARTGLQLTGSQEVPVKTSTATGSADISYDKSTKMFSFTINWQTLTGTPTGAHIHGPAARGTNAGIKYDFFSVMPKTVSGTFTNSVMVDGVSLKEDSLLAGFYYFNIHTPTNPGGEIRGQIEFK